jgi:hypothetical protein
MRRTLVGLAAVGIALLALSGCAGAVLTDQVTKSVPTAQVGSPREDAFTANRAAARRDAADLLTRLRLPQGAVRARIEPSGDHGYLKAAGALEDDTANATAHAWWTIAERPSAVIAYVSAARPAGSTQSGTGSAGNIYTHTSALEVGFQWPPVGNVLGYRELQVTATALPNGETGVLAEAQSDWIVLRAWSERVPSGITTVRVTLRRAPKRIFSQRLGPVSHALIKRRQAVASVVSLVDSLSVVQPIVIACPLQGAPAGALTVTYSAGPAGPALAQAKVMLFPGGRSGGAGECDPIAFSIRGHAEKALIGASFVRRMEKLAGFAG